MEQPPSPPLSTPYPSENKDKARESQNMPFIWGGDGVGGGGVNDKFLSILSKNSSSQGWKRERTFYLGYGVFDMALGYLEGKQCKQIADCKTVSFFLEIGFSRLSHEARKPDMPIFMFMYMYQWLLAFSIYWWKDKMSNLNKKFLINNRIETETRYKLHNRYGQK